MLIHQKLRNELDIHRASRTFGAISDEKYRTEMNRLGRELEQIEQKMYEVTYDGQLDLLRFITGTIPEAFKKIHAAFPHFDFEQVVEFEKTVRNAGGSVTIHSGHFAPTERYAGSCDRDIYKHDYTWTCCHSISVEQIPTREMWYDEIMHHVKCHDAKVNARTMTIYRGFPDESTRIVRKRIEVTEESDGRWDVPALQESRDLRNPNPIGRCDAPRVFSLTEDFKVRDNMTVAELKVATRAQIDELEFERARLAAKAKELNSMLETLSILTDP